MTRLRPPAKLRPFDAPRAAELLRLLRAGRRLDRATHAAGLTQRCVFTWLAHAQRKRGGPELAPYREFAAEFHALIGAAMGMPDDA